MIQVFQPNIYLSDYFSVLKNLLKGNISGTSPVIYEFEEQFSKKFDRKYGIAVSNGSVALDIALQAINLEKDDEVIIPSLTIVSVLSAVLRTKARPIFVDVDINTWNTSFEMIKEKITNKTKAIVLVHTYGLSVDLKEVQEYCKEREIIIIEDTAEAHGQQYNEKYCGTFGDISTFSFYANKHITTGEGGILLTDNEDYYNALIQMRNLDFDNTNRFLHQNMYWNYRMSGLQAALGISQLKNMEKTIKQKINQGNNYLRLLENYEDLLQLPLQQTSYSTNHYWVFGVVIKNSTREKRDQISLELKKLGIETRPFFWPLHKQNFLNEEYKPDYLLENTDYLSSSGFYLPLGKQVTSKKQKFIVENLINTIKNVN